MICVSPCGRGKGVVSVAGELGEGAHRGFAQTKPLLTAGDSRVPFL
jgi:hypothetical protein